jgi:YVTN family beta-propeller protein
VRFRVLGPLEVRNEQATVPLGSAKQRALLGVLLLHANETVSTARLADELWGDDPPATAEKLVQGYVHALRRQLGPEIVETRPPGYRVRVERDELDLLEFDALIEAAQNADMADAMELRRRALALWRGAALADVALEGPDRHALARLSERRLTAQIALVEAGLELGRHAELVGELELLAAEHPFQERIAALLMLALYRSGRQADALDVYRTLRRRLNDELGLEPGQELRDLESAILRQDPALAPEVRDPIPVSEPAAEPADEQPRRAAIGRRRLVGLAAAAALTTVAAVVVLAIVLSGSAAGVPVPPNSVAVLDPAEGRVVETVEGLIRPGPIAIGAGAVWVGNLDDRTLVRIDPETFQIVKTIPLPGTPDGLAVSDEVVWVVHGRLGQLTRVDPDFDTVVETIPVAGRAVSFSQGSAALDARAVWVAFGDSTLARVDPASNATTGSTLAGRGPAAVVTGYDSVWVSLSGESRVRRFNPVTFEAGDFDEFSVGRTPIGMAVGDGAVWVACRDDDRVFRIDAGLESRATQQIAVGDEPSAVAFDGGAIWVTNTGGGTLSRIDPEANEVVETIEVGNAPAGVAVDGLVWVTVQSP